MFERGAGMWLHVPTLILAIMMLSVMLCLSIGWVARRDGGDGLRPLTLAMAFNATGFVSFFWAGTVPFAVELFVRNAAITAAVALLIYSVSVFYRFRVSVVALTVVALAAGLGCAVFPDSILVRVVVATLVLIGLELYLGVCLWRGWRIRRGRAQYLVMVGVALNLGVMVARVVAALLHFSNVHGPTDSTLMQGAVYVSALVALNLVAVGFVLMTKEASDEKLTRLAMTDRLTGVWNRNKIEEVAHHEILRLRRYGSPLSMIMLDIDHFKHINDTYGHVMGDAVLDEVVTRTLECVRETDVVGRWGGEEFIVLLPSSGLHVSAQVAERIRIQIAARPFFEGIAVTVSQGLAACQTMDSWLEWLARADAALYRAKEGGRNRVETDVPISTGASTAGTGLAMLRLVWHENFSIGHAEIDAQHFGLFEAANGLLDMASRDAPFLHMCDAVRRFLQGLDSHLRSEEQALEEAGWHDLATHRARHANMADRANQLADQYAAGKLEVSQLLHFIIYEVTAQHILGEDSKFVGLFAGQ